MFQYESQRDMKKLNCGMFPYVNHEIRCQLDDGPRWKKKIEYFEL